MKDLFIADSTITIRDTEENRIEDGMLEKLDSMLDEYGVKHFFTLPIDSTDGTANNDDDCVNLFYDERDILKVELIYSLWLKIERNAEDDYIYNVFRKKALKVTA